jgi:hypothetical protein
MTSKTVELNWKNAGTTPCTYSVQRIQLILKRNYFIFFKTDDKKIKYKKLPVVRLNFELATVKSEKSIRQSVFRFFVPTLYTLYKIHRCTWYRIGFNFLQKYSLFSHKNWGCPKGEKKRRDYIFLFCLQCQTWLASIFGKLYWCCYIVNKYIFTHKYSRYMLMLNKFKDAYILTLRKKF